MKSKKLLIAFMIALAVIPMIGTGCGGNNGGTPETDNPGFSNLLMGTGYENCLICHNIDDKNSAKNLNYHCLNINPVTFGTPGSDYSPKLQDCLLCHTSHSPDEAKTTFNCAMCHY
ncbi:MAG: hypothetical protein WC958_00820 [Dehalococcoidales bacterium]